MKRNVLIIPDKFKGTLTAPQAARAIERGWRRGRPDDVLQLLPMSDGGDGFGPILGKAVDASSCVTLSTDAAGRPCRVRWWKQARKRIAMVESARVIGLSMLPSRLRRPLHLDTTGLGQVLNSVVKTGCSTCVIGLGGSATNDGGFGMARSMGWCFLDQNGGELLRWPDLVHLRKLRPPTRPAFSEVIVATDVRNPLLGQNGASRIFGPQKGLRPVDQRVAEAALRQLAQVTRDHLGFDHSRAPGAGAAGGLGFGLMAFLDARPEPGFEVFARYTRLDRYLDWADLVVTGEGAIDASSLMGKGVGEIARRCRNHAKPCLGLGGVARDVSRLRRAFSQFAAMTDLTQPANALARPGHWLTRLTEKVAGSFTRRRG